MSYRPSPRVTLGYAIRALVIQAIPFPLDPSVGFHFPRVLSLGHILRVYSSHPYLSLVSALSSLLDSDKMTAPRGFLALPHMVSSRGTPHAAFRISTFPHFRALRSSSDDHTAQHDTKTPTFFFTPLIALTASCRSNHQIRTAPRFYQNRCLSVTARNMMLIISL